MFFFEGSSCPVCGKQFEPSDDIVACPVCGTPHHRDCYNSGGGCACEARHAEGYTWSRTEPDEGKESSEAQLTCGVCGAVNPPGRLYCNNCSSPLGARVNGESAGSSGTTEQSGNDMSGSGVFSFGGDSSVISDGELIKGVPVGDVKRFVGSSWFYHIPMFLTFDRYKRSVSFNLLALFLHGIWFVTRKMYALGFAILATMLGILAFQTSCLDVVMPLYEQMAAGDMSGMMNFMTTQPILFGALTASAVLEYAILIVCGLFANRIYMGFCIRKIKKLNRRAKSADEFNQLLETHGGTSLLASLVVLLCYFGIQYLIQNYTLQQVLDSVTALFARFIN